MLLQFSPSIFPLIISSAASFALAILVWRRRHTPSAQYYLLLMLGLFIWSIAATFELMSVELPAKVFASKITYFGIVTVITSWVAFVLQQTGYERWLNRRTLALLLVEPVMVLLLVWTNEYHYTFWATVSLMDSGGLVVGDFTHGFMFWVHAVYAYVALMFATVLLIRRFLQTKNLYRRQIAVMLLSILAPWIGNVLFLAGFSNVDLTPFGFIITSIFVAWGLLRFRMLDIVPVAREAIIEKMPDGLVVLDAQNRILDVNEAALALAGIGREAIGKTLIDTAPHIAGMLQKNVTGTQEMMVTQPQSTRILELQVVPVYDERQRLRGSAILMHDITERQQAAQRIHNQNVELEKANHELEIARLQAEEATRLKSQFLATMSHELRTPLTAIMGYTEIQLAGMAGELNPEQRSFQDRVLANADHLLNLINEILDLAKIEAGSTEITSAPFNVRVWLDEVLLQTEGLAKQKSLTFDHTLDSQIPPMLMGDAARLKQIVINLLGNAVKFTEKGFVKLEISRQDSHMWSISVSDSGIGIPMHMQNIIFEEFRQVDNSSTRNYGGTGLGLAIVRKLVLLMGGNVRLRSQVGQGSTFTIALPMLEAQPTPKQEEMTA